jgi:hypothetical protein
MTIEQIAELTHEANRLYCRSLGDNSQAPWSDAPQWQKDSAINGVKFHLDNPDSKPSESHESWLKDKRDAGWTFGPVKDPEKKQHPCFVPYEALPAAQQVKDKLFLSVVRAVESTVV